jgi:glycosyltransferase involved in cell wall biosynthesis
MLDIDDVTIFVPTWNRERILRRMIESLDRTMPSRPGLIVWDDASTDGTRAYLRTVPRCRLIEAACRTSLTHKWNHGVILADTPFVILANDDLIYESGGWWDAFAKKLEEGYDEVRFGFGFIMLPLVTVRKVGWFDERFPELSFEDDDWLNRFQEAGLRSFNFNDQPWIIHDHSHPDFNGHHPDVEKRKLQNKEFYFQKWSALPTDRSGVRPRRRLPEVDWYPGQWRHMEARIARSEEMRRRP